MQNGLWEGSDWCDDQSDVACCLISSSTVLTFSSPTISTKSAHAASSLAGAMSCLGGCVAFSGRVELGSTSRGYLVPRK